MIIEEEITKYRKKQPSSTSKSKYKSKHKHKYDECVLVDNDNRQCRATYCTRCGKIHNIHFFETVPCECGRRLQNRNEIDERYKNLIRIEVDNIFQKHVNISEIRC